MDLSHAIVLSLASDAGSRLAREAQRSLHSLRDGLHSGEDSGLETTWEEICVQVQGGEMSIHWDTYEHVARATCGQLLEKERPVIRKPITASLVIKNYCTRAGYDYQDFWAVGLSYRITEGQIKVDTDRDGNVNDQETDPSLGIS